MFRICAVAVAVVTLISSCGPESGEFERQSFEIIVADDLKTLEEDVSAASRLDSCYYVIREYEVYEKSRYSARAVVDFYILKGNLAKVVRKYRYHTRVGQWERYYNKYHFIHSDSTRSGNDGSR